MFEGNTSWFVWTSTHLLHGQLFEDGVIFMQAESAEPVQDAVLLRLAGLGRRRRLRVGLGARLGMRWVQGGLRAAVWIKLVLQLTVCVVQLGRSITGSQTPGGRGLDVRREGGGRERMHRGMNGGRKRRWEGGNMRGGADGDRVVCADDGLDACHSVHCPEEEEKPLNNLHKTET